jgi:glycosyltransferase involved in cell wall biosynthesis
MNARALPRSILLVESKVKQLRVAFVVQRYGLEVNGGSEALCRMIAERMARFHNVEVITTRAVDYVTWQDEYPEGTDNVNGILVRRFGVDHPRDQRQFEAISGVVFGGPHTPEGEDEWMRKQGPYSSRLLAYLETNRETYDVFVFFTYLYCTTYFGLPLVKDRAVLVSTCHDEPPIYLGIFDDLFRQVRHLIYLTPEERAFAQRRFYDCSLDGHVIGIGVDPVADLPPDPEWESIRRRLGSSDFILYVGRIDESKGCKTLIEYFTRYVQETEQPSLKLIMVGKAVMPIPDHPQLVATGFLSEATKLHAIQSCRFMVAPSPYESLCMSILESWLLKRPVLTNGDCNVLRGQCLRSNGGLWYSDYETFKEATELLLRNTKLAAALGQQGHDFVQRNCIWSRVDQKYLQILSSIAGKSPRNLSQGPSLVIGAHQ